MAWALFSNDIKLTLVFVTVTYCFDFVLIGPISCSVRSASPEDSFGGRFNRAATVSVCFAQTVETSVCSRIPNAKRQTDIFGLFSRCNARCVWIVLIIPPSTPFSGNYYFISFYLPEDVWGRAFVCLLDCQDISDLSVFSSKFRQRFSFKGR